MKFFAVNFFILNPSEHYKPNKKLSESETNNKINIYFSYNSQLYTFVYIVHIHNCMYSCQFVNFIFRLDLFLVHLFLTMNLTDTKEFRLTCITEPAEIKIGFLERIIKIRRLFLVPLSKESQFVSGTASCKSLLYIDDTYRNYESMLCNY